jgi:excisionase family DNA binding protein
MVMGHVVEPGRPVLSSREASKIAGLRQSHIDYLIRQGKIEAIKVGATWLVYEDSLQKYLTSPRKPGPKPKDTSSTLPESSMTEE